MSLQDRVDYGVDLLNQYFGGSENWVFRVEPESLDITSGSRCVLGQVFEDMADDHNSGFDFGIDSLGIGGSSWEYGFSAIYDREIKTLQDLWVSTLDRIRGEWAV